VAASAAQEWGLARRVMGTGEVSKLDGSPVLAASRLPNELRPSWMPVGLR
jgi:hypothetical protein